MDGAIKELGQEEQAKEMIFALSPEQENHLQEIGYTNQEIAAFQTSAKNESDVEFLTNLAEGDYANAFQVNPGALSDLCKLQLSNYEAILATRPGQDVYARETQKQANALFMEKSYDYTPGECDLNTYGEYFSVIKEGLEQQNGYYADYMSHMCSMNETVSNDYITYGENLNSSIALWDSFDKLSQRGNKDLSDFENMFGTTIANKSSNIQISGLNQNENGQYGYLVNLADPSTLRAKTADYIISVEIEQKEGAADVLGNVLVNENAKYKSEINDLDQKAVLNTVVSAYDAMVPFPVKDGYEMLVSLDGKLNGSDLVVTSKITQGGLDVAASDDMQLSSAEALGKVSNVMGVANEVGDGVVSYYKDKEALEAKILSNNQTLSMAQSGQMTEMYVTAISTDGNFLFSDKTQIAMNNVLPEVQYNMNRWQTQGIDAYLGDLGVENIADVKEELLDKLNPEKITLGMYEDDQEVTDEQIATVEKAIDTMINGGDFSEIPSDVFQEVQGKINIELENEAKEAGMPMGLNDWVLKRNGIAKEAEKTYGLENEKINWEELEIPKLNLMEPKLVILDLYQDEKIDFGDLMDEGKLVITPEEVDLQLGGNSVTAPKTNVSRNVMTR